MKTEFKDVAHLYLGCKAEVELKSDSNLGYEDGINTLDGIMVDWLREFKYVKPILRPLSDMSNEEIKELQEMGYSLSFPLQRILDENGDELRMDVFDLAELTLWLTSKSFDICNLIESGQAIDKTTLSQPEREEGK